MITVHEADRIIRDNLKKYPPVDCKLKDAYGKILREEVRADRDYPPFNKSLMDGIAIKLESYLSGRRSFPVIATIAAGEDPGTFKKPDSCVEIMTGAVVPKEFNCVIPVEEVSFEDKTVHLKNNLDLNTYQCIRRKGTDIKKGIIIIPAGNILNSVNLATAANVGKTLLKVSYQPKVAVVSTGDEIVPVDTPEIHFYQTRQSNSCFIESALKSTCLFDVSSFHLKDNKKMLIKQIGALLEGFDILIFSGGVSMGKFDYVPEVLKELGIQILFHKVKQKPGKPFLFGKNKKGQIIFALPGNPVSTQIATYRYVIWHLKSALGVNPAVEYAKLAHPYTIKTDFVYFLPVKLKITPQAHIEAASVDPSGSGDFAGVVKSDGFMEIPEGIHQVKEGFVGKIYRWS